MSFIKKYNSSGLTLLCSQEFQEGAESFIYNVGHSSKYPTILKTDSKGKKVWQQEFVFDFPTSTLFKFHKIIKLYGEHIQYILIATDESAYFLINIDERSNVLWTKRIGDIAPFNNDIFLVESKDAPQFYFISSLNGDQYYFPVVMQFDEGGNLVQSKEIRTGSADDLLVSAAVSYQGGIALLGKHKGSYLQIIDFDNSLNLKERKELDNSTGVSSSLEPHDLLVLQNVEGDVNEFIVSGYDYSRNQVVFFGINKSSFTLLHTIPNSSSLRSGLCMGLGDFYLYTYDKSEHIREDRNAIYKITFSVNESFDFSKIWSKTIANMIDYAGIKKINYCSYRQTLSSISYAGDLLIHSDIDLNTCATQFLSADVTRSREINVSSEEFIEKEPHFQIEEHPIEVSKSSTVETIICPFIGVKIRLDGPVSLQSSNFILTAAGSNQSDGSTMGVHLRWIFGGNLGANHLPKGNLANTTHNFNKPNDFVKLYRAPYQKFEFVIDFQVVPNVVNNQQQFWIYKSGLRMFYIYFKNSSKYNQVLSTVNPLINPQIFIKTYGNELIEIESKKDLFFKANLSFSDYNTTSSVNLESLSVIDNSPLADKYTYSRKKVISSDLSLTSLNCENGKSIRLQPNNCYLSKIGLELYTDFIVESNNSNSWEILGNYSLTLNDHIALHNLEPLSGIVNNRWPRFVDNAMVNIQNYIHKWNGPLGQDERNIKKVVEKYIELSQSASNPNAVEQVYLGNDGDPNSQENDPENDYSSFSLLEFLNIGATDFHIARLLGLGTLDVFNTAVEEQYVYLTEYVTLKDVEHINENKEVKHISMSMPTGIYNERLPVPYILDTIQVGIITSSTEDGSSTSMTAEDGYTHDGKNRYVTLLAKPLENYLPNENFYPNEVEFDKENYSLPVYAGINYKMDNETEWTKPELPSDSDYYNAVPYGVNPYYETVPLIVAEETNILYIHKQTKSGIYFYNSYGINIFSRATASTFSNLDITTNLKTANTLQAPSNINVLLIESENPLLLTSGAEQELRNEILDDDKTLVRLTFDYHSYHELSTYKIEDKYSNLSNNDIINDSTNTIYSDSKEIYADEVEVYFRDRIPENVSGKVMSIIGDPGDPTISSIVTGNYYLASTDTNLVPTIPADKVQNYIGGLFVMGDQQYVIQSITTSGSFPIINVYNIQISDGIVTAGPGIYTDVSYLQSPEIVADGLFTIVENMQNLINWVGNPPKPKTKVVHIGVSGWTVKREIFQEPNEQGIMERYLQKSRGFWSNGNVTVVNELVEVLDSDGNYTYDSNGNIITQMAHNGMYKAVFTGFTLPQHPQIAEGIDFYKGIVRLKTNLGYSLNGERKLCKVVKIENIGTGNLILYFVDEGYQRTNPVYDKIRVGTQNINFYPGYRVYLYKNNNVGLNQAGLQPAIDQGVKYSIFGLRSHCTVLAYNTYFSRFSNPALLFAQELITPMQPLDPIGAKYATRPDFYGKSTYSFKTEFKHRPYAAIFGRSNDESLLNVLYTPSSISKIREHLTELGGNDEKYLTRRWDNFFNFEELLEQGSYSTFSNYAFPLPDNSKLISSINEFIDWHNQNNGSFPDAQFIQTIKSLSDIVIDINSGVAEPLRILHFIQEALYNTFVPLTELPIIYQYIKPNDAFPENYEPISKKQHIRDRNGHLLNPVDLDFDMAPMVKVINKNHVLFTDFTLDGTSNNLYFYATREMGNKMELGPFSTVLGPIKLINSNYPEAPEIKKVLPVLRVDVLNIPTSIEFEINSYPEVQNIRMITIYRATNPLDAVSIRTMKQIKEIDIESEGMLNLPVWKFKDYFSDLLELPYGDPLFYRISVSRRVEYLDSSSQPIFEFAPSQPSKIIATMLVESYSPDSPVLHYYSTPLEQGIVDYVTLYWNKTAYNATYHIYKMNSQGNWVKIHLIKSNEPTIYLPLEDTELDNSSLNVLSIEEGRIYHHFKVIAENTSGMLSAKENILTIYNEVTWQDIGGISTMIVGPTFIVQS